MKVFIIEDEFIARNFLAKTLTANFPEIEIAGMAESVCESVEWLNNPENRADLIFMDVVLTDGHCFDIFKEAVVNAHVVITTAYDKYALKAFENNCIDYLLKPVKLEALERSVERYYDKKENTDIDKLVRILSQKPQREYEDRLTVRENGRIVTIATDSIALLASESKDSHLITKTGTDHIVDGSLDSIMSELDPGMFFRISRSHIISKDCVGNMTKTLDGKLNVIVKPLSRDSKDVVVRVSRFRVKDFLTWLES